MCRPWETWLQFFDDEGLAYLIFDLGRQAVFGFDGVLVFLMEYGDQVCIVDGLLA